MTRGSHLMKVGGEVRMIRMTTDRMGGTTYSYSNLDGVPRQHAVRRSSISATSASRASSTTARPAMRHTQQEYYVGFAQDEWKVHADVHAELRPALRLLHAAAGADNLLVKFNIDTGVIDPNTTPFFTSRKTNFQPRVSTTYALERRRRCSAAASACSSVRARRKTRSSRSRATASARRCRAARLSRSITDLLRANFVNNPNTRSYQPRAYANDYTRARNACISTPRRCSASCPAASRFTGAYVGSQGRNLFLRSVANQITQVATNPNPANAALVIREFSIVQRDAAGNITGVQNPYAEVDYKTSGGHDTYNAMQLSLARRVAGPDPELPVHAGRELRQHRRLERSADGGQQRHARSPTSTTTTATTTSTCATRST